MRNQLVIRSTTKAQSDDGYHVDLSCVETRKVLWWRCLSFEVRYVCVGGVCTWMMSIKIEFDEFLVKAKLHIFVHFHNLCHHISHEQSPHTVNQPPKNELISFLMYQIFVQTIFELQIAFNGIKFHIFALLTEKDEYESIIIRQKGLNGFKGWTMALFGVNYLKIQKKLYQEVPFSHSTYHLRYYAND